MKKFGLALVACYVCGALVSFLQVRPADGYLQFSKAFMQKYIGDESTETQKALAVEFNRVKKCAVCHDPRKGPDGKVSKKNRNPYGELVNKHLNKKDQKDIPKAIKMLDKIAEEKLDGSDKTVGELLQAGKLPFLYPDFDFGGATEEDEDD